MSEKKSFWQLLLQDAISRNPVLIQMLAVCTLMAAGTLKFAVVFSAAFCLMFFVTQTLANLFMSMWKRYFRVAAYAAIGTGCALLLLLLMEKIDDTFTVNTGIYLTMIAVSGITVLHCEKVAVNVEFMESLREAAVRAIGYSAVIIPVGTLRELLGTGGLWGHTLLPDFGIAFFAHPASTLVILGFMAAILRILVHEYLRPYAQEVALKISDTPVTLAEAEPQDEYAALLPEGGDADEIPRPVGYVPPEPEPEPEPLTEPEAAEESDPWEEEEAREEEITASPAALEDTQQKFEDMLAELRRRYLDD